MRLATFNLLHGRSLADGAVDANRIAAAVADLDVDVAGLQEVDRGQPRSHRLDLTEIAAKALVAPYWRFAAALVGTPGGRWRAATDGVGSTSEPAYGVGLVSRWPVRDWQVIRLARAPVRSPVAVAGRWLWLADEPRVLLAAVLDGPDGPLTVATTHLSFVPGWNALQLRRVTATLARLPAPRLLLGDLNLPAPLPRWLTGWRPLAQVATYPAERPSVQLDHVLANATTGVVSSVEAKLTPISDHLAVVVDLDTGRLPRADTHRLPRADTHRDDRVG